MHLINTIVLTCPKCKTVIKLLLSAISKKIEDDNSYELKCQLCSYNFSEIPPTPVSSEDNMSILNRTVVLANKHNISTAWLENLRDTRIVHYE